MSQSREIPRIKRLSSALANQIAAGEVIERPASVIKELVENCLDAGASRIVIDISKAGSQLIRVIDDGHGIHPEDLQLALERHATAKLNSQSDLSAIRSLGFRGEALPSISSVATLTLTSRINALEQATSLSMDPDSGKAELVPAAHPVGTTVEVRNLFHNTPARRKFLRSERTEFLHILEMVRRLALSRADVSMELRHNDKRVLVCRAAAGDLGARVASLMGQPFVRQSIALDYKVNDMRLWGWLGVAALARSTSDKQYFYLNGRMIRDKRLNHAIRLACEDSIAPGRFPSYLLYLEMDLAAADVNVHPSKHEVRFRHARDVHDFLYAALSTALKESQHLYAGADAVSSATEQGMSLAKEQPEYWRGHNIVGEARSSYGELMGRRQGELINDTPALGKVLLQINRRFMLTQRDDEIVLVNIVAAKKHIALTRLNSVVAGEKISARPLLVPVSFAISAAQEQVLSALSPWLEEYALELALAGPGCCGVRAIPGVLADADIETLLDDLLKLKVVDRSDAELREAMISIMVTHVCDILNPHMSGDEMTNLLRQVENSGLDVGLSRHTPIWRCLGEDALERLMSDNE